MLSHRQVQTVLDSVPVNVVKFDVPKTLLQQAMVIAASGPWPDSFLTQKEEMHLRSTTNSWLILDISITTFHLSLAGASLIKSL